MDADVKQAYADAELAIERLLLLMRDSEDPDSPASAVLTSWALIGNFTAYDDAGQRVSAIRWTTSLDSDLCTALGLFAAGEAICRAIVT